MLTVLRMESPLWFQCSLEGDRKENLDPGKSVDIFYSKSISFRYIKMYFNVQSSTCGRELRFPIF